MKKGTWRIEAYQWSSLPTAEAVSPAFHPPVSSSGWPVSSDSSSRPTLSPPAGSCSASWSSLAQQKSTGALKSKNQIVYSRAGLSNGQYSRVSTSSGSWNLRLFQVSEFVFNASSAPWWRLFQDFSRPCWAKFKTMPNRYAVLKKPKTRLHTNNLMTISLCYKK